MRVARLVGRRPPIEASGRGDGTQSCTYSAMWGKDGGENTESEYDIQNNNLLYTIDQQCQNTFEML